MSYPPCTVQSAAGFRSTSAASWALGSDGTVSMAGSSFAGGDRYSASYGDRANRCAHLLRAWTAATLTGRVATHRRSIGTRSGTRRLTPWSQAMLVLRFLIDGTRISRLAADNVLPSTMTYDNRWEGLEVLAATAPSLAEAIDAVRAADNGHIDLDGTLRRDTGLLQWPAGARAGSSGVGRMG